MPRCFLPLQSRSIGQQIKACPYLRTRLVQRSGDPPHLEASLVFIEDMSGGPYGAVPQG